MHYQAIIVSIEIGLLFSLTPNITIYNLSSISGHEFQDWPFPVTFVQPSCNSHWLHNLVIFLLLNFSVINIIIVMMFLVVVIVYEYFQYGKNKFW